MTDGQIYGVLRHGGEVDRGVTGETGAYSFARYLRVQRSEVHAVAVVHRPKDSEGPSWWSALPPLSNEELDRRLEEMRHRHPL